MKNKIYIIFTIFLILFSTSICTVQAITKTLAMDAVGKAFVFRMNDVIYANNSTANTNTLLDLQNTLLKEESLEKLVKQYTDFVTRNVVYNNTIEQINVESTLEEIQSESLHIIEKKLGKQDSHVDDGLKDAIYEANTALYAYATNIQEYAKSYKPLAILYYAITSNIYILFYVLIVIIMLKEALKSDGLIQWLKKIQKCILLSACVLYAFGVVIRSVAINLTNVFLGRTLMLTINPFYTQTIGFVCTSIMLFIIQKLIAKHIYKEHANEVIN